MTNYCTLSNLILNKNIKFNYNPFGGISDDELKETLIPKPFFNTLTDLIRNEDELIIELVGAKGRGKTSHLKLLHEQFSDQSICLLNDNKDFQNILNNTTDILFIDSIHHLSFVQRIQLFRSKRKIILTAHYSKFIEYIICNRRYKTYKFKGIDAQVLEQILIKRIHLAAQQPHENIILNKKNVQDLIKTYKDDYRAILHHLYDNF